MEQGQVVWEGNMGVGTLRRRAATLEAFWWRLHAGFQSASTDFVL